jgi:hypothetical protein
VSLTLVGCNSATPSPTPEIVKTLTETPTQIEPTVEATATIVPEATATPTETPAFYEKNWGNWAKTLDAADVEKNGVIIPYNPVDNPEEFNKAIEEIKEEKNYNGGGTGVINIEHSGIDPKIDLYEVMGVMETPYQIMYFKYGNNYYPLIIDISGVAYLIDSDIGYQEFIDKNQKGMDVGFYINKDPNNEVFKDLVAWNNISEGLYKIAVKTGIGVAAMGDKQY